MNTGSKKMKVYINGRFLTQRITGVQRYALEIVRELDGILSTSNSHDDFFLLVPHNINTNIDLKNIQVKKCGMFHGHIWEQLELPLFSRDGYLISLCGCAPLFKRAQTVTIHDAAVAAIPESFTWLFRKWYTIQHRLAGKVLSRIYTVSDFSRNELNKWFNIPLEKIEITYNGVEHLNNILPDKNVLTKYRLEPNQYILAVSSMNPSKNFKIVAQAALKMQDHVFAIAGGSANSVFNNLNIKMPDNVKMLGYVSDEELMGLYQHAMCFVYPSLYEGFGIPPLEAMYNKCPVIVSDCASLPEVCGDAALYCNPHDVNSLYDCIEELSQEKVRNELIAKGIKRCRRFTFKKSAELIYKNLHLDNEHQLF